MLIRIVNRTLQVICLVCAIIMSTGTARAQAPAFHNVTATAAYRPVSVPGTQRRVAQTDAEAKARKELYEYAGSMRLRDGRTINDVLARDAKLKARLLDVVRNSELVDWAVSPACACVQVWMRLDLNKVMAVVAACGY